MRSLAPFSSLLFSPTVVCNDLVVVPSPLLWVIKLITQKYLSALILTLWSFLFITCSYISKSFECVNTLLWMAEPGMWASPRVAGLTLDNVWVMKAIKPTVTLTRQSGVVYCRPSLTYTEVVNTISTSGEVARRAAPPLLHNVTAESETESLPSLLRTVRFFLFLFWWLGCWDMLTPVLLFQRRNINSHHSIRALDNSLQHFCMTPAYQDWNICIYTETSLSG